MCGLHIAVVWSGVRSSVVCSKTLSGLEKGRLTELFGELSCKRLRDAPHQLRCWTWHAVHSVIGSADASIRVRLSGWLVSGRVAIANVCWQNLPLVLVLRRHRTCCDCG